MRLPQSRLAQIKNYIHIAQALILFLAWALTIAVFTRSGSTDGRTGWYFGLCWLTIPILVYQTMVPMWSRARRFSNIYVFVALDFSSIILWLSAWAAVTSYVVSGKGQGNSTDTNVTGCDNFSHGSPGKCKLSEGTIILGVIIMVLFIPTAYISFKGLMEYKRTGILPEHHSSGQGSTGVGPLGGAKPIGDVSVYPPSRRNEHDVEDDAFDSNMNARNDWEIDEYDNHNDPYHSGGGRDPRQGHGGDYGYQRADVHDEDEYTSSLAAHSRNHSEVMPERSYDDLSHVRPAVPGGPLGHDDTEYRGGGGGGYMR